VNARLLDGLRHLAGDALVLVDENLARPGVHHRLGRDVSHHAALQTQLLVELVPAHPGQVIALGLEEEGVE
jgi:hypothetical protein